MVGLSDGQCEKKRGESGRYKMKVTDRKLWILQLDGWRRGKEERSSTQVLGPVGDVHGASGDTGCQ